MSAAGPWHRAAPLAQARDALALAAFRGRLYALGGGLDNGTRFRSVEVLDGGGWAPAPPMRHARAGLGAAVLGDTLYAIGGRLASTSPLNGGEITAAVEAFDGDAWRRVASLTTPRRNFGVGVIGDRIFVVGGEDARHETLATVESFDPESNTWSAAPAMTTPRMSHSVAVLDGKLYALGGINHRGDALNSVEVLDLEAGAWLPAPDLPAPRAALGAAAVHGELWALAGFNPRQSDRGVPEQLEVFSPRTGTWTSGPELPAVLVAPGVAVLEDRIYVAGGYQLTGRSGEAMADVLFLSTFGGAVHADA